MDRDEERRIIAQVCAGDANAVEALVVAYQKQVYNLALRTVGNEEDAADMTQEVFLRAYRALGTFRGESKFSVWLYRLTTNVCIDFLRSRRRHPTVSLTASEDDDEQPQFDLPADERTSPEQQLTRSEMRRAVARATALGVSWTDIDNRAKRYDCEPTLFAYIDDTKNRCPGARLPHLSNPSDAYKTSESIDRSTDNASTIDSGSSNRYDAHLSNDRFHHFITSNHSTFYNYCKSLYENRDNILNHLHYPSKFIEYCTKLKLIEVAIHQMRSLFDEAQIPFILLKGAPMGQAIFGSARARSTTDIDVWIPRAYRSRTRQSVIDDSKAPIFGQQIKKSSITTSWRPSKSIGDSLCHPSTPPISTRLTCDHAAIMP